MEKGYLDIDKNPSDAVKIPFSRWEYKQIVSPFLSVLLRQHMKISFGENVYNKGWNKVKSCVKGQGVNSQK